MMNSILRQELLLPMADHLLRKLQQEERLEMAANSVQAKSEERFHTPDQFRDLKIKASLKSHLRLAHEVMFSKTALLEKRSTKP
jgi:hypothetical protein